MARIQWGSRLDGAWRLDRLRQAAATRTVAPGTASAWRCRLSRQAVIADFVNLEALGAWRYLSPARRSEVVAPSGTCPPLGDLVVVNPSYWTL